MKAPTEAFPLTWPEGWKRTGEYSKEYGRFGSKEHQEGGWNKKKPLSMTAGRDRVLASLNRMGARSAVISTNVRTRLDGVLRSGEREPDDAGVAVYWTTNKGQQRCMAIDRYKRVADNLAAVAGTLEALRTVERYGGAMILDRAFTGFVALPPPLDTRTWRQVLRIPDGVRVTPADLEDRYKRRRSECHPDKGGAPGDFDAVQKAYDQAKQELGYAS